jgi:hypothetical protein
MGTSSPQTNTSGKPPQQQSDIAIIRDLLNRVAALEKAVSQSQGITFVSPNGTVQKTLSVDNTGAQVWA